MQAACLPRYLEISEGDEEKARCELVAMPHSVTKALMADAFLTVVRRACLQEDEGREHDIQTYDERASAEAWIEAQKGEYFSPSDYYSRYPPIVNIPQRALTTSWGSFAF